jgi:hypothetical protein
MATKKVPSKARKKAPASKTVKDLPPKAGQAKDVTGGGGYGAGPFRRWR